MKALLDNIRLLVLGLLLHAIALLAVRGPFANMAEGELRCESGGAVVVRYRSSGVEALSATPADGWSVSVEQPGGPLVVNFRTTAGNLSRLEATWSNGPKANLIEK